MTEFPTLFSLRLPAWLDKCLEGDIQLTTDKQQMQWVVELSAENVEHGGGPFAAALFEEETGKLLTAGVNLVLQANQSMLHAEMVVLALAHQELESYDLSSERVRYRLVSSSEPCVMCMGGVLWSGVDSLFYGASDKAVRSAGFDEGPKHPKWQDEFAARGIKVSQVCEEEAVAVLKKYAEQGGVIYGRTSGL